MQLVAQHCCKALLPVLPPPQATCQTSGFAAKSRTEFYFVQHVAATCNTEICCTTSRLRGGNTGNRVLQLAKQQCCATSCMKMLPVLLDRKTKQLCLFLWTKCYSFVVSRPYHQDLAPFSFCRGGLGPFDDVILSRDPKAPLSCSPQTVCCIS